ncbi:MAG: hypothetical protein IPL78_00070 [Chloroflexi bacterium]|nr:hypothetical protein [Chloroflexota bacterium]
MDSEQWAVAESRSLGGGFVGVVDGMGVLSVPLARWLPLGKKLRLNIRPG